MSDADPPDPVSPARAYRQALRAVIALGVSAGVFGATFGAVSVGSGSTVRQTRP